MNGASDKRDLWFAIYVKMFTIRITNIFEQTVIVDFISIVVYHLSLSYQ